MKTNTATLSRPTTGIYTTAHAIDRAWGLTAFTAFNLAEREQISFEEALERLPQELEHIRFHEYGDEMEGYEQAQCLDFDIIERYNQPIVRGGVSYELPSATSVEFWKRGWVLPSGSRTIVLAPGATTRLEKSVMQILNCLTINNGYGRSAWGAYLRDKLPRAFAWTARLANDFADGRASEDRFDFWHHQLVDTARVGYLALAKGAVFRDVKPYDDARVVDGGLAPHLELFCKAYPAIAAKLKVRDRNLSRIECLFTLPGYLVALYAIGEGDKVEEKYDMWRKAFHMGEKALVRRKELAAETVVQLQSDRNFFRLAKMTGGVGLFVGTDDPIGKELWRFFRSSPESGGWSPLQETFMEMLELYMVDEIDGQQLDQKAKKEFAMKATRLMGTERKAVIGFVRKYVTDEDISESLARLVALHNLKPAVMVLSKSDGHYVVLTNGHLGVRIDLRDVSAYLNEAEPGIWHVEGREISGRFELHMVMSGSTMLQDRKPSKLKPAQLKEILSMLVDVIN